MADEQQQAAATEPKFDFAAWKAEQDAGTAKVAEAAKVADAKQADAADKDDDDEGDGDHTPKLPRSVRREINKLRAELGETKGRLSMLQELQAAGFTKAEAKQEVARIESTEPTREQFQSDAEYIKALTKFETGKAQQASDARQSANAEMQELLKTANANTAKYEADAAKFPDWEEAQEAMAGISLDGANTEMLVGLFAESDQRAGVSYYWAKHPDEFKEFLKMSGRQQIRTFHRLEERVETLYSKKVEEKPAKPTAAELDAKKARPTAAVAVKGGQATEPVPSMLLADGRTLNPAWKNAQNEAAGLRR